jgi:hypothetical protein
MRRFIIGAVATALGVAGFVLAAPANAELGPGNYNYRSVTANGVVTNNTLRVDSCGPGCISLFNVDLNLDQGQARVVGAQYILDQFVPSGARCADGRAVDIVARYTFDLDGTNGLYTLNGPNPCEAGPVGSTTFTLTPA